MAIEDRCVQAKDQRRRLRAVVALWDVQQVLPLLTGGNDGTGGGAAPIRKVEDGVEKPQAEQQHDGQSNENEHDANHDLPEVHGGP
jgi:hypothetical protein